MKIKGLEEKIKDFKDRKNYLETTLDTLNNTITSLNKDIEKKDRQIKTYNEVIDSKNNELLQAQKVMEAMTVLNHGLKGDIEKLKDKLQGAIDKGIEVGLTAKEHEKHLLNDITLYFNWIKDLDKNLKELEAEKQKKEGLRDQELADLRQERDNLQIELHKELSWWDKWINDEGDLSFTGSYRSLVKQTYKNSIKKLEKEYEKDKKCHWSLAISRKPGSSVGKSEMEMVVNFFVYYWKSFSETIRDTEEERKAKLKKGKQFFKLIYEYYKNK